MDYRVNKINILLESFSKTDNSIAWFVAHIKKYASVGLRTLSDSRKRIDKNKMGTNWVLWMGRNSNLHSVWDTDNIRSFELSYTELARELNTATPEQIEEWQQASICDWAYESIAYRDRIYNIPGESAHRL